jgi:hypothetical protein
LPLEAEQIDDFALAFLKKHGESTGSSLYEVLSRMFPSLTEDEFVDVIERLSKRGRIAKHDELKKNSFWGYLTAWEMNTWFYMSVIISAIAVVAAYRIPATSQYVPLRWAFGLLFVLYVPGYVALQALYPATELDTFMHAGLSVGLSLVLDMISGLLLNYSPWGIRLVPVVSLLVILTICLAVIGLIRKFVALRTTMR